MKRWLLTIIVGMLLTGFGCSDDDNNKPSPITTLHVATNGSDINPGSTATPLLTIQTALEMATTNTNITAIRIAEGTYYPGNGLLTANTTTKDAGVYISAFPRAIRIEGGWDAAFSIKSGSPTTILNGQYALKHCVLVENASNIILDNLIIVNGKATGSAFPDWSGGGIYLGNAYACTLTNIYLYNNYADTFGGGFCVNGGSSNMIHTTCSSNYSAGNSGGGGFLDNTSGNAIVSTFISNRSKDAGGLSIQNSSGNSINSTFLYNSSSDQGGALYFLTSPGNTVNSTIIGNTAALEGGGIYVFGGSGNTFSGLLSGNSNHSIFLGANCSSTKIINASITNAYGTNIIYIRDSATSGLVISNCLIGGSLPNTTAIVEGLGNITGHTMIYNAFVTNSMEYLYRNYTGPGTYTYSDNLTDLNNNAWSGAAVASGNIGIE